MYMPGIKSAQSFLIPFSLYQRGTKGGDPEGHLFSQMMT
jgi:hypothetical protein